MAKSKVVKNKKSNSKNLTSFKSYEQRKILSLVFNNLEFKDLLKINSVNKQWNQLINPICKESLRLTRPLYIEREYHDRELSKSDMLDLEVKECISTNEKHAKIITKFKWNTHLSNDLTIEFFTKFSNLTHLFINRIKLSQDLILTVIKFLRKLKVLSFREATIKEIITKRILRSKIKLPSTLRSIEFKNVILIGNTELFIDSINSHTKIEEVTYSSDSNIILIDTLKKPYPTLKSLKITAEYTKFESDNLIKIIEPNPQLRSLELHSNWINQDLLDSISNNLTGLEELIIRDITRKCNISEFDFTFNFPKLKILVVYLTSLNLNNLEKLLTNSTNLKELHIALSEANWKGQLKLISNLCSNLTHLILHVPRGNYNSEGGAQPLIDGDEFLEEFKTKNPKSKNTLKSLSLSNIPLLKLNSDHFSIFKELMIINLRCYTFYLDNNTFKDIRDHFKRFDEFKLRSLKNRWASECYLTKAGNSLSPLNWSDYDRW
jgi:hypothetical protein